MHNFPSTHKRSECRNILHYNGTYCCRLTTSLERRYAATEKEKIDFNNGIRPVAIHQQYCDVNNKQDSQCTYNLTLRGVRAAIVVQKVTIITYSECVSVSLFIQHAVPMLRILLLFVPCPVVQYFYTLAHIFGGGGGGNELLNTKSVFCF